MSYKITLEVYVNENVTHPTIRVEGGNGHISGMDRRYAASPADTEALESDLTKTRKFAESLVRGVIEDRP